MSRTHPKYKESPVFGLAGFVLPSEEVRGFGTWFFQRKCQLLQFEIDQSGIPPTLWEKKGASLYTVNNVTRYPELRKFTKRLFNKIKKLGGFVFYVGIRKTLAPAQHRPNSLYGKVFVEAIKRLNDFCQLGSLPHSFIIILDEHDQRSALITKAAQSMYSKVNRRRHLIEPPFHLESHRYQTLQAADWIAGLVGRLGAIWVDSAAYPQNIVFQRYFQRRMNGVSQNSGIRN